MEFKHSKEKIWAENDEGKVIAEVDFPITDGVADINHTFVDDCLRGQGIAGKLLVAAVAQIRAEGLKALPTCSYAKGWFEKHPEEQDLLA